MSASYAIEKFSASANLMATSSASLQQRLRMAYMTFHPAQEADMPTAELKEAYRSLMQALTAVKDAETGYVPATTAQMTDEEAGVAADLLWDIYSGLRSWRQDNPGLEL
jgi:hypothetical protein